MYGYWLFALGLVASVVGVLLFLYSATLVSGRPSVNDPHAFWTARQVAIVLAAGGVPLMLGRVAIRLPLRRLATRTTSLGMAVCIVALAWFLTVYPAGWTFATGNPGVIGLYTLGLFVIGLGAVGVPMLSRSETEPESERAARHQREREETARHDELSRTAAERDEARAAAEASGAELEVLRRSQARFELYEDNRGEYRWRLRQRNGNIVATSGEGYSSRQKAQQDMHSVRRNALGAEVMTLEPDGDFEATEADPIEVESRAAFELYEDGAGEWRWRLVHENGNVVADSGQGYASRQKARQGIDSVRNNAGDAGVEEQ